MDIEKKEVRNLLNNKAFMDELVKRSVSDTKLLGELAEDIADEITDHFENSFEVKALISDDKLLTEAIRRAGCNEGSVESLVGELERDLASLESVTRKLKKTGHRLRDVNIKLRETQDQLIQSEKLAVVGRLVASVAHELSNPLGAIKGLAQLDQRGREKKDPIIKDLKTIEQEANRAYHILRRLQTFARPKKLEVELIDVNKTINETLLLLSHQASVKNIKNLNIEESYQADLPKVKADPQQIIQVFLNILLNASQAISEHKGGKIHIKTSEIKIKAKRYIEIEFTDNGHGIAEKDIHKIFKPFFSTREIGSGLGLAICRSIIERHHGNIAIKSKVGKGSTFLVRFPI